MRIQIKFKPEPAAPPEWRVKQPPANVPSLLEPSINPDQIRPRHDQVHYETHVALPSSLQHAIEKGRLHHVNPCLDWISAKIPILQPAPAPNGWTHPENAADRWRAHNRIYVATQAVTWSSDQSQGMIPMEHILWADDRPDRRLTIHTRDAEYLFPPLCRAHETAAAINRILEKGSRAHPAPTCQTCRHYRRRPMRGNQGDCEIQPKLSTICCPLNGLLHRCQLHEQLHRPGTRPI